MIHKAALLLAAFLFFAHEIQAQTATIEGVVTNAYGEKPVAGVNVVVVGSLFGAVTNADGSYRIADLPEGSYQLQVIALGFEMEIQQVTVAAGEDLVCNWILRPTVEAFHQEVRPLGEGVSEVLVDQETLRKTYPGEVSVLSRQVPGLQMEGVRSLSSRPVVRGAFGPQMEVLYHGIRLIPETSPNISLLLNTFPLSMYERLEIVKGPASVMGGAGALATMHWQLPELPAADTPLHGEVMTGYTSHTRLLDAAARVAGAAQKVSYQLATSYRGGQEEGVFEPSVKTGGLHAGLRYQATTSSRLDALAHYAWYEGIRYSPEACLLLDCKPARNLLLASSYQHSFLNGLWRQLDFSASWQRRSQSIYFGLDPFRLRGDTTRDRLGAKITARMVPAASLDVLVGGEVARLEDTFSIGSDQEQSKLEGGVFVQALQKGSRLETSALLRIDRVQIQEKWVTLDDLNVDDQETNLSAVASATFKLSPRWRVATGLSLANRFTTLNEYNLIPFAMVFGHELPALSSRVESFQGDVRLEADLGRLQAQLEGFGRRTNQTLLIRPYRIIDGRMIPSTWFWGDMKTFGVEASGVYALFRQYLSVHATTSVYTASTPSITWLSPETIGTFETGFRLVAPAQLFSVQGTLYGSHVWRTSDAGWGDFGDDFEEDLPDGYLATSLQGGLRLPRSGQLLLGIDNLFNTSERTFFPTFFPTTETWLDKPGRRFFIRVGFAF